MTEIAPENVLKRKAEAGRGPPGGTLTPEKALGQALAKAGQDMMKLPLSVAALREARMSVAEIVESLPDRSLLALLEGPKEGLGLMVLAPDLMTSLIEMQTTRRIGKGAVTPRRPTRTDAAMTAPFIDRVLGELEVILAADPAIIWAGGFRYASHIEEARPLGLLLEDGAYRAFLVTLDCGDEGGRQGALILALPAEGRGAAPARQAGAEGGAAPANGANVAAEWGARMEAAVFGARAGLHAVLDRVSMPLSAVLALKPGSLVPIAPGALTRLSLEGSGGRVVARGKLGQSQGHLAIRLAMPPDGPAEDETEKEAGAGGAEPVLTPVTLSATPRPAIIEAKSPQEEATAPEAPNTAMQ